MAQAQSSCGHGGGFQGAFLTAKIMQNGGVATPPDRSKPVDRNASAAHDFFLDPLPVPDATESNSDTAWGLWEHTLRSHEEVAPPTEETSPDFAETLPSDLMPLQKTR